MTKGLKSSDRRATVRNISAVVNAKGRVLAEICAEMKYLNFLRDTKAE
jgi:hypothetical protein